MADPLVVKGEFHFTTLDAGNWNQLGSSGIASPLNPGKPCHDRREGDCDHPATGIAVGVPIGLELFQKQILRLSLA